MTINIYDTRLMIAALEKIPQPKRFLKDTFFANEQRSTAEHIDFDVKKFGRTISPFVSDKKGTSAVERPGFDFRSFVPPTTGAHTVTTAADVLKRGFGANVYSNETPTQRSAKIMQSDFMMLNRMIARREEWMIARLMCTGKIIMQGDGVYQELDLSKFWNLEDISDTDQSFDDENSDIIGFLDDAYAEFMRRSGGLVPDRIVLGHTAARKIRNNKRWQDEQKYFKTELGQWTPRWSQKGVKLVGLYMGMELYEYLEWFLDDLDTDSEGNPIEKLMVDDNVMLMSSSEAITEFAYGAIYLNRQNGIFALPRVPHYWSDNNPAVDYLQLQSRPVPIPKDIDAFMTIKVCKSQLDIVKKEVKSSVKKAP